MVNQRLRSLRERDNPALSPLWIETLPLQEALDELRGRRGPVFRLQECDRLLELGRTREALDVLSELDGLAEGLTCIRARLAARAENEAAADTGLPGNGALPAPQSALAEWLRRVRGWRRVLRA